MSGLRSADLVDRDHAKRMRLILIADGHVLARREGMRAKAISGFVVVDPGSIIIEHPARMLLSAGLMDDLAGLIILPLPEPYHLASLAVRPPLGHINVPIGVERDDELIAV
jgi:hypothetical protein